MTSPRVGTQEVRLPKHAILSRELKRRVSSGEYPVGSRIPPVRELSEEFSVSPTTALKGIQKLVRERLVFCHPGAKGTIVLRHKPPLTATKRTTLACLLRAHRPRNMIDNFGPDMIQGVREEISGRKYRFVYHCLDETDYEQRMIELLEEEWVCGILLDQCVPISTVHRLAERGLPVALYNREVRVQNVSTACPDYFHIGRETFRFFVQRGYERLAHLSAGTEEQPLSETHEAEAAALCAMMKGFRFEARMREPFVRPPELIDDAVTDARTFSEPEEFGLPRRKPADWRTLGIFALNDTRVARLIEAISKTDLVIGRDVGVVGCFDLTGAAHAATPPSTWRIDAQEVGRAAVGLLIRKIEDGDLPTVAVRIRAEFLDRGTA